MTRMRRSFGRFRAAALACATVVLVAGMLPASAYPRPGRTELVSVASDGTQGNDRSGSILDTTPAVSPDGRYVAFESMASNLVPGITNGVWDIFVHDRAAGTSERVSVASDGTEANGHSTRPSISADGRYVAFASFASNLVPGDTNNSDDVFVHDRETGTTERVSVATDGTQGNSWSFRPSISADGRYVAFDSGARTLVPGVLTDGVYIHDRQAGTTEAVSLHVSGQVVKGEAPSISADGRHVAFHSDRVLIPGDTNGYDVFVHDRETGLTERVSVASDGTEANRESAWARISAGGRFVAFHSFANNLVPGDTNGLVDVFVHDRETGRTERASVSSTGAQSNSISGNASVSADGRHVLYWSAGSNLVPGDTNGFRDVFVHDRVTGATERVSVSSQGQQATGGISFQPTMTPDGRLVVFESFANNLVPGDTNGHWDVFLRDRGDTVGVGELSVVSADQTLAASGWVTLSGGVLTAADDPDDDGGSVGPLTARDLGAELTGASVAYRPEQEDLFLRLHLHSLPHHSSIPCAVGSCFGNFSTGAGAPGVLYGLELQTGGIRYEVRALRASATSNPPSPNPRFALFRCQPGCTEIGVLAGAIGASETEVVVALPLAALGAGEGADLRSLRAFTAVGETAAGAVEELDDVTLPDASIPHATVSLGVGPAGAPAEAVAFDVAATLDRETFSGTVDASSLSDGEYRLWARACLGESCRATSRPVTLG